MPELENLDKLFEYGMKLLESIEADDQDKDEHIVLLERILSEENDKKRQLQNDLRKMLDDISM